MRKDSFNRRCDRTNRRNCERHCACGAQPLPVSTAGVHARKQRAVVD
jgi:hypothetical protein